eukprot:g29664.t1
MCVEEMLRCVEEMLRCVEEMLRCVEEMLRCVEEMLRCVEEMLRCVEEMLRCVEEMLRCVEEMLRCVEEMLGCVEEMLRCVEEMLRCVEEMLRCIEEMLRCVEAKEYKGEMHKKGGDNNQQRICESAIDTEGNNCKWGPTCTQGDITSQCTCGGDDEDYICLDPADVQYIAWIWAAVFAWFLLMGMVGYCIASDGEFSCILGTIFGLFCGILCGACYCMRAQSYEQRHREARNERMNSQRGTNAGAVTHADFQSNPNAYPSYGGQNA